MTQKLSDHIRSACVRFEHDPPTSDYQRGYLSALIQVGKAMKLPLPYEQWQRILDRPCRSSSEKD